MERKEFEQLIKDINAKKYYTLWEPAELFPDLVEEVATELDVDKHRWYEISTSVYKIGNWYLGLQGVTQAYSEMSTIRDMEVEVLAFEMEAVPTVTYKKKE